MSDYRPEEDDRFISEMKQIMDGKSSALSIPQFLHDGQIFPDEENWLPTPDVVDGEGCGYVVEVKVSVKCIRGKEFPPYARRKDLMPQSQAQGFGRKR